MTTEQEKKTFIRNIGKGCSSNPPIPWTLQSRAGSRAWTSLAASVSLLLVDGQAWGRGGRTRIGQQRKTAA